MKSGPKPLPASLRQATGRHDGVDSGGRAIASGPALGYEAPMKPDHIVAGSYADQMWDKITKQLAGLDVLRSVDETSLAALCETYERWREAVDMRHERGITDTNRFGQTVRAPWTVVESDAAKQLQSYLQEFGLTPSSAANLGDGSGAAEDDDVFAFNYD